MPTYSRRLLPASIATAALCWAGAFGCCLALEGTSAARVHSALLALAVAATVTVFIILATRSALRVLIQHIDAHVATMGTTFDQHCRDLGASMRHIVWADREDQRLRDDRAVREWIRGGAPKC